MNAKNFLFLISSFVAGFSLMVLELTSTRILASYLGVSIYTWTSIIGIILLGLSLGSYVGGFLIDKYCSLRTVFIFFILSSLFTAFIPILAVKTPFFIFLDLSILPTIILVSLILFFLPAFFMGTLYPAILKLYSVNFEKIGFQAGKLSFFWSIGSIVGTFLTGFYFISYLGNNATIFFASIILFINGLFFYRPKIRNLIVLIIFLIAIIYFSALISGRNSDIYNHQSAYYNIRVIDVVNDILGKSRALLLDFDVHSVEKSDDGHSVFYPEIYPVFSVFKERFDNILVLGGGSYSIAKNFFNFYKNAEVTVVEIDPAVTKAAEDFFDLKSYPINTIFMDGRVFLQKDDKKYDLIFGDTFNSFMSLPWHLTTKEFNDLIKSRLAENGIYAVNFISAFKGKNSAFFQSMFSTFKQTFDNYQIFSFGDLSLYPQNIILVGINSDIRIDPEVLKEKIRGLENGEFLSSRLISKTFPNSDSLILTDNFAPVEKLMMPLINSQFHDYASFYYSL